MYKAAHRATPKQSEVYMKKVIFKVKGGHGLLKVIQVKPNLFKVYEGKYLYNTNRTAKAAIRCAKGASTDFGCTV